MIMVAIPTGREPSQAVIGPSRTFEICCCPRSVLIVVDLDDRQRLPRAPADRFIDVVFALRRDIGLEDVQGVLVVEMENLRVDAHADRIGLAQPVVDDDFPFGHSPNPYRTTRTGTLSHPETFCMWTRCSPSQSTS